MKKIMVIAVAALVAGFVQAQELTPQQTSGLMGIGIQYAQKTALFEGMIQGKLVELNMELMREGRLDSEKAAKASGKKVNAILNKIGALYGEFTKSRVAFMLEAKNVLTTEQKIHLLKQLQPGVLIEYEEVEFLQPGIFDLPINLSIAQRKKLVGLEAGLLLKEVKLERDIELVLLDIEALLMADVIEPAKVDKQVMKLADLAAKAIENRVGYFIDAKDVLSLDQKRLLAYWMGL